MMIYNGDMSVEARFGMICMLILYLGVLCIVYNVYKCSKLIRYEYNSERKNVYI